MYQFSAGRMCAVLTGLLVGIVQHVRRQTNVLVTQLKISWQ